jgi:hypothetical protein
MRWRALSRLVYIREYNAKPFSEAPQSLAPAVHVPRSLPSVE